MPYAMKLILPEWKAPDEPLSHWDDECTCRRLVPVIIRTLTVLRMKANPIVFVQVILYVKSNPIVIVLCNVAVEFLSNRFVVQSNVALELLSNHPAKLLPASTCKGPMLCGVKLCRAATREIYYSHHLANFHQRVCSFAHRKQLHGRRLWTNKTMHICTAHWGTRRGPRCRSRN